MPVFWYKLKCKNVSIIVSRLHLWRLQVQGGTASSSSGKGARNVSAHKIAVPSITGCSYAVVCFQICVFFLPQFNVHLN